MPWSKFVPDLQSHTYTPKKCKAMITESRVNQTYWTGLYNTGNVSCSIAAGIYHDMTLKGGSHMVTYPNMTVCMSNKFAHGWLIPDLRNLEGSEANSGEFEPQLGRKKQNRIKHNATCTNQKRQKRREQARKCNEAICTENQQAQQTNKAHYITSSVSIFPAKNPDATLEL